jgi:integrase
VRRQRVLSEDELGRVLGALRERKHSADDVAMLLLLTGCRKEEIAGLTWPEVQPDRLAIDPARHKSLSRFSCRYRGKRGHCFRALPGASGRHRSIGSTGRRRYLNVLARPAGTGMTCGARWQRCSPTVSSIRHTLSRLCWGKASTIRTAICPSIPKHSKDCTIITDTIAYL